MTDRWLSFFDILASAFPILSAVRYSQFLPDGVMYQANPDMYILSTVKDSRCLTDGF
jgi:hypothetical protein